MAYVYMYLDPRKTPMEVIYIGKGRGKRMFHHRFKTCDNSILKAKIDHILKDGLEVIIEKVIDNISDEEAMRIEIELIAKYGRICNETGSLCNFTEGGEGTYGYKHKKETIKLFSEQRAGKKQTDAQYKANCARRHSEEIKTKMSLANKGHSRHSEKQMEILKNQEYGAHKFLVTLPNGEKIEIKNLKKFCKENNLDRTTATKSATKNISYKGYWFQRL
jgi:hypothetical protein